MVAWRVRMLPRPAALALSPIPGTAPARLQHSKHKQASELYRQLRDLVT